MLCLCCYRHQLHISLSYFVTGVYITQSFTVGHVTLQKLGETSEYIANVGVITF